MEVRRINERRGEQCWGQWGSGTCHLSPGPCSALCTQVVFSKCISRCSSPDISSATGTTAHTVPELFSVNERDLGNKGRWGSQASEWDHGDAGPGDTPGKNGVLHSKEKRHQGVGATGEEVSEALSFCGC